MAAEDAAISTEGRPAPGDGPGSTNAPTTDSSATPLSPVPPEELVIIGNGMVGHRLCEELTRGDRSGRFRLVVFGEEPRPAYDRVRLTEMLGGRGADALELHDRAWYARRGIELVLDDPVMVVDRPHRVVRSRSGREQRYDRLVFATGSAPAVPDIDGKGLPGVFVYRTVADLEGIAAWSAGRRAAVVIGGGLLGLEAARALHKLGLEVTVLEGAPHLMPNQLDGEGGAMLAQLVGALGIAVRTGARIGRLTEESGRLRVDLTGDATPLGCDLVVLSTGIRPRDKLAAYAGIDCGPRGGILVDGCLQTSDPTIHAIGDCAIHDGVTTGLVAPGYRMAEVLAERLCGAEARFEGSDRSARLKLFDIDVAATGDIRGKHRSVVHRAAGVYRKLLLDRGRLVGAMGVGPWLDFADVQRRVAARERVWPWPLLRFWRTGRTEPPAPRRTVAQWPATTVVCHCMGVTRGTLATAIQRGCATVEALATATRASSVCGGCRPHLVELLGSTPARGALPGRRLLGAATILTVLALLLWTAARPVPLGVSVQGSWHLDVLWRSGVARQLTGFGLLALVLFELLLVARRRWPRFSLGSLERWRGLHGLIGASTLLALALHTGLRAGANLNRWLLLDFVAVSAVGAAAGGAVLAGGRLAAMAGRWQPVTRMAHAALVWPLIVLLAFHVLAAYWF